MTNWDYYEAARRFQKVLEASGINSALVARDIQDGDSVVIGDMELEWSHDQVLQPDPQPRCFSLLGLRPANVPAPDTGVGRTWSRLLPGKSMGSCIPA